VGASGHAEEEMERVVLAVLGEEGDEGGVGDDVGGREGEEEAEGVGEEVEFEVSGDEGVGEMGVFFVAFEERGVDGLGQVGVAGAGGHVEGVEEGVGLRGKVVGAMAEFVAEREGGRWFGVWRRKGRVEEGFAVEAYLPLPLPSIHNAISSTVTAICTLHFLRCVPIHIVSYTFTFFLSIKSKLIYTMLIVFVLYP